MEDVFRTLKSALSLEACQQNLRSLLTRSSAGNETLWPCEDELSLALAPRVPAVEALALHNQVGHQAQGDMVLLGALPWQGRFSAQDRL